ncbi:transaldolase [Solimonas aquatica]|uniref:Transaldolase n=1 Tax=Solimonas aquatica TaxID=489703 RepID=A0A1H9IHM1_9GAMM|nr:transaldolase [Solimonas aquatica]SEQ74103.1 transaldolase [Solimonas aquatica]
MNRLQAVHALGQSIWLDYIHRQLMLSGGLRRLIEEDAICGLTSNPAIFEKAVGSGSDYDASLKALLAQGLREPQALFEQLAIEDIRLAADDLRKVYERSAGADGYVSLEVSPHLAHDAQASIEQARRLHKAVARDNLMIKVPGTPAGVAALRTLIGEGIKVNVTLLFSRAAYRAVAEAYIDGVAQYVARGGDAGQLASVASFFVSRIDSAVDAQLGSRAPQLQGKVAIANARLAYQDYKQIFSAPRWRELAQQHRARPQRLLWASTGTKNPQYRDTLYVEELIGPETVNTVPPATLDAFRDHGEARSMLEHALGEAQATLDALSGLSVSLETICEQLVVDGLKLFVDADDKLMAAVAAKRERLLSAP